VEGTEQVRPIASSRGSGSSVLSPLHLVRLVLRFEVWVLGFRFGDEGLTPFHMASLE
jgi:hypothetical protein